MEVLYSKEHEWIRIEGNTGTVGITEYAVDQLGDITYVELPDTGKTVAQDDILCSIESVKAASDVYNPLSGKITAVNEALKDTPEIINESPLEKGWIARLELQDLGEKTVLMNEQQYKEYIQGLTD